jgi:hypothetical protein
MYVCMYVYMYVGRYVCMYVRIRFIATKMCAACSRTSYNIVLLSSMNKYIQNYTRKTEKNIYLYILMLIDIYI